MPRISLKKRAALDILDWLFFTQTWFLRLIEDDEMLDDNSPQGKACIALNEINRRVNEEVDATGTTGVAAQALKHTVYCILEAGFTDDTVQKTRSGHANHLGLVDEQGVPLSKRVEAIDPAEAALVHEYDKEFFMGLIAACGDKIHGVCIKTASTIAATVGAEFSDIPSAVRYRLTERVFIWEFMYAPVQFLSWMYRIGVITSKKFVAERVERKISDNFKARVGLLCEFTLMRDLMARLSGNGHGTGRSKIIRSLQDKLNDKLSDAAWMQLQDENDFYARLDRHKKRQLDVPAFNLERLEDEDYLHEFLERFAENHWRSRFWTGPQHSWTGMVGAGMMWSYHSLVDPQRKITRNGNNYRKSGEQVEQEETVAQLVCQSLNAHGLDCRPGSLYETYLGCYMKKPAGLYHRATIYHELQQKFDVVLSAKSHDIIYLSTVIIPTL